MSHYRILLLDTMLREQWFHQPFAAVGYALITARAFSLPSRTYQKGKLKISTTAQTQGRLHF